MILADDIAFITQNLEICGKPDKNFKQIEFVADSLENLQLFTFFGLSGDHDTLENINDVKLATLTEGVAVFFREIKFKDIKLAHKVIRLLEDRNVHAKLSA